MSLKLKGEALLTLNEKVVYPGHGVAKIVRILEKNVGGSEIVFYELNFLTKDMTILVPSASLLSTGVRKLASKETINKLFELLVQPPRKINPYELNASSWNKRNKFYQSELRTGDLLKMANIYRDLHHISYQKELSFGERNLLMQIEQLLAQEISLVLDCKVQDIVFQLRSFFTMVPPSVKVSVATV